LLAKIHSGHTTSLRVGPYENAEVIPLPPASAIRKSGMLHFIPAGISDLPFCRVLFGAFGGGGWMKPRDVRDELALGELLETLGVPRSERERITNELRAGRPSQTLLSDIRLDFLYRSGLV
jgi:hypothetical protein